MDLNFTNSMLENKNFLSSVIASNDNLKSLPNEIFENKITFQDFDIKTFANRDYKSDLPLWEIQFKIFKSNLINKFQNSFISFLSENEIEETYDSVIEKEFFTYFHENRKVTLEWFFEIFGNNLNNAHVLINLLKVISKVKFEETQHYLAIGVLLSNKDLEVKDYVIRFFANMNNKMALKILESAEVTPLWLNEYRLDIIQDIKENLDQ